MARAAQLRGLADPSRAVFWIVGEERVLALGHSQGAAASLELERALGFHSARAAWRPPSFTLARAGRATRTWRMPDAEPYSAGLLVKSARVDELMSGIAAPVEPLPITVEGEPWTLLHCLAAAARLDEERSDYDPPPVPHPFQRYLFLRRVVLSDDPRLYDAFFTIDGTGRAAVYCGAGFRARVQAMGLVGLGFRETGYFHRPGDPEPPPTRPGSRTRTAAARWP